MADASTVSVCVLVYNHANVIETTLQTILEQSLGDYEVVVSDDCSTDGTWEILSAFQEKYPRIRAIRTPRNLGTVSYTHLDVYKRQIFGRRAISRIWRRRSWSHERL